MATTKGFTVMHMDEFERPWPKWLLARRSLGVTSFGINVTHLEPGEQIPEHTEGGRDHEEVYITITGETTIVVDGEEYPLPSGAFARLDPELSRYVKNDGASPARVLIVSAPRSSGYEPLDWA